MKNRLCFIILFFGNSLFAQNNCNCEVAIEKLIATIESDYPGFKEKTVFNTELYNNHKTAALEKSKNTDNQGCIIVLNEYASFFKDEHIYIEGKAEKKQDVIEIDDQKEDKPEIEAKTLASNIFYIRISSFKYENIDPVRDLMVKNKKHIEKSKALIIDIRDNFGGTDEVYQPLLPYVLTNPLRIMNVEFLSTPTLISGLRNYALQNLPKDSLKAIQQIEDDLREYKENLGKFVLYDGKKVTLDTIQLHAKGPKQIIFLANKNVASAGENFLFSVRQSKKVKILGTPSMGVLDYGSIREFELGCDNYTLYLPTYRSARLPYYPIDNIGIQPDVYLDDTVDDWLDFAIEYIKG
jgi:hypothetical protein